MALSISPVGQPKPPEQETPRIYHNQFKHSLVDSAYQPETSLLVNVDGTPRLVEWYRQFLSADEEPLAFQPFDYSTYQSYTRIKNMVIKDEGDGAFNYNPDTGESSKDYQAYVIFDLVPIKGDVFITDIGDGNAGLCIVTEQPEMRNITANKVYLITYKMVAILSGEMYAELDRRVVKELVYSKDSALMGGNAVISEGDFDTQKQLFQWMYTIGETILRKFYWSTEETIYCPGPNNEKIYDQYLVEFLCAVIPPDLRGSYPFINRISTQYGGREFGRYGALTIFDVVLRKDFNLLSQCSNEAWLADVRRMASTRAYGNIRNTRFDWCVITDAHNYTNSEPYFNMDGYPILRFNPDKKITYLFSNEFYKGTPMSELEKLIIDVLKNNVIDRKALLKYCQGYFALPEHDQLYHGAFLLILLQASRKIGVY